MIVIHSYDDDDDDGSILNCSTDYNQFWFFGLLVLKTIFMRARVFIKKGSYVILLFKIY